MQLYKNDKTTDENFACKTGNKRELRKELKVLREECFYFLIIS